VSCPFSNHPPRGIPKSLVVAPQSFLSENRSKKEMAEWAHEEREGPGVRLDRLHSPYHELGFGGAEREREYQQVMVRKGED